MLTRRVAVCVAGKKKKKKRRKKAKGGSLTAEG